MATLDVDAVLFDSDGVLVDSHDVVERAWRQLAVEFGLDADRLLREHAGVPARDTLSRHLPAERSSLAVARLEDLEVDLADRVAALPGSRSLVEQLPRDRWAIVTSASRRLATARWETAGFPVPPNTITADDVSRGKPHPQPYLKAAEQLGVQSARCVVFEDSPSGGRAAAASGATVVAVGRDPWEPEPSLRIHSLANVSYTAQSTDRLGVLTVDPIGW